MTKRRAPKVFNSRTRARLERRPSADFRPATKAELKRMGFSIGSERLLEKSAKRVGQNTPSISRREYLKKRGFETAGREAVPRKARRAPTHGRDCLPHGRGRGASGQATGDAPPRRAHRGRVAGAAAVHACCPPPERPEARAAAELCHPRSSSRCGGRAARQDRSREIRGKRHVAPCSGLA